MRLMSAEETVVKMGAQYLKICCLSFGSIGFAVAERFLISTCKTLFSMLAQVTGALTNIVLDYVFIYLSPPYRARFFSAACANKQKPRKRFRTTRKSMRPAL